MRPRLFGYSIATICIGSLIAAASSCGRLDSGADGLAESDIAATTQAVSLTGAVHIAGLVPGAKLTIQQVAAITNNSLIGQPCPMGVAIGAACQPPIPSIVRECGGFTSTCDSTGTEDILPIDVTCLPTQTGNLCFAISEQTQKTIDCVVSTEGKACSDGCGADFCAAYPTECAVRTNQVRNCFSNGNCHNDVCSNQTFTQEVTGTCTRETDGFGCTPTNGQSCQPPLVGLCTVSHVCGCLLGPQ